jgi:uncharacterized damage-inducible protein DinB
MTREQLLARRDYFNLVHGVTIRAITAFSDRDLDVRPRPGLRTPRELIFHIYAQEKLLAEAAREGQFTIQAANGSNPEDPVNANAVAALATVTDAVAYANFCHQVAEEIFRAMSDVDVARPVESPMGIYPAWQYFQFAYDEHWHHRGQLFVYLRLLGKEPPSLYDYQ